MERGQKARDLRTMSREELYKLAQKFNIKGRSALTKEQLVEQLTPLVAGKDVPDPVPPAEKPAASAGSAKQSKKGSTKKNAGSESRAKQPANEQVPPRKQGAAAGLVRPEQPVIPGYEEAVKAKPIIARPFPDTTRPGEERLTGELPLGYGDTRIVLQVRDPHWAHVYWEIADRTRQQLRRAIGDEAYDRSLFVLRVYDVTDITFDGLNAHSYYDVHVFEGASNWYLNLGRPNCAFLVDIGIITPSGEFLLIARSNAIRTPRDTFSETVDDQWMVLDEEFREIYRASGGFNVGASSGEVRHALTQRLSEQLSSGALSSHALSSGALSSAALSSPGAAPGGSRKEKDFWLVVNTELIVYGATEPDATLTVQGRQVKLRPDGTFTLRFALPDGHQNIPVRAVNADGDMERTITPVVEKVTR
ncbi:MAG TPA: DUF4912 domain-containing protein [Candidatus Ozemobacteraceae bacterium]|mgnify:CR=1 FL=1|nr:DUF4912 domain-containing protein [Candidatus Ozemobacteraceae bacterium]